MLLAEVSDAVWQALMTAFVSMFTVMASVAMSWIAYRTKVLEKNQEKQSIVLDAVHEQGNSALGALKLTIAEQARWRAEQPGATDADRQTAKERMDEYFIHKAAQDNINRFAAGGRIAPASQQKEQEVEQPVVSVVHAEPSTQSQVVKAQIVTAGENITEAGERLSKAGKDIGTAGKSVPKEEPPK